MSNSTVKIVVATHKKYIMPTDSMYVPIHVGAEGKKDSNGNKLDLGYIKDNTGNNISKKNASFCELTGLYWAWKNLDADFVGLVHYRRHFSMNHKKGFEYVLAYEELKPYLDKVKVFVPKKQKYYIESLYSHYAHTHYASHLDETRIIIEEKYPEYLEAFDRVIKHTYGFMFNMMIMRKELLEDYCSWLFDILFALEKRIGVSELSTFQGRFYGRVSEIIFNVWIDQKLQIGELKQNEIMEIPYVYMEKINWNKKLIAFLKAKFFKVKYNGSF
ncbi:DUF4422 domain-containing protein [Coprococcus comes]|uniref:DUF4422 domain-containing protein n=1 Tax=Coprococcus comes TaxID=410072 RepID=UPI003F898435